MRVRASILRCISVLLTGILCGAPGCGSARSAHLARFSYTQIHMGVEARIVLYAPDEAAAKAAARAGFECLARLDAVMSDYRQDSELMRVGQHPPREWVPVSEDLFDVLAEARRVAEATEGAFDCTVGPLSALWRRARAEGILPDAGEIAAARSSVGWRLVELDAARRAVRLAPGVRIDLGGIGKGYAAEQAAATLRQQGAPRCLVALAGDVVAGEAPPGEAGWRVAVQTGYREGEHPVVMLARGAVSTSGDTEQFVEIGGVRYSHILDPSTGLGLTSRTAATVVATDGAIADALASAMCVLGPDRGEWALGAFPGTGVRMVVDGRVHRFGAGASRFASGPSSKE